jgi:p-cumate 2,3-dioxygenase ferredoxin reductase component
MSGASARGIVIVGAGQAGARAAEALRVAGYQGGITLVGSESHLPYERPQLSKELLLDRAADPKYVRGAEEWASLGVDILTGVTAVGCDARRRLVTLSNGGECHYDKLLLATGTRVRRLASLEAGPVPLHYLRSIDDAMRLRQIMLPKSKIVLIGGGVIGLEVAAAAIERGCSVTVVEARSNVLAQLGSAFLGEYFANLHRMHGVVIRTGVTVVESRPGRLNMSDGSSCVADFALVGIGVEPAVGVAKGLGLSVSEGIRVDAFGATEIDNVYAAGDVTLQWNAFCGSWMRIENWANAQNQAVATAKSMIGMGQAYDAVPWFWSDQYRTNLQVAGNLNGVEHVVRGNPGHGPFAVVGLRDGEIVGAATINHPREMAMFRRAIAARARCERGDLENPSFDLRGLLRK